MNLRMKARMGMNQVELRDYAYQLEQEVIRLRHRGKTYKNQMKQMGTILADQNKRNEIMDMWRQMRVEQSELPSVSDVLGWMKGVGLDVRMP
jgi:hypothetical protein